MFLRPQVKESRRDGPAAAQIDALREVLRRADAIVIGAGAGLSTSAGFAYTGERFHAHFYDFEEKYGIRDMYSGCFYPFETLKEQWAWWSRVIYYNRYMDPPRPVYKELFEQVREMDYFVLTTNVDHCFVKAGFDKKRLFYTQGDYGLWQCSIPCDAYTMDNEALVLAMMEAQGFVRDDAGILTPPEKGKLLMCIPEELVPYCPKCGAPMTMNLRCDDTFAEDEGWHRAASRYSEFLRRHQGLEVVYLELGVGANTPGIIKYPFWRMTERNPKSTYVCINYNEACCPKAIAGRSICINADIGNVLEALEALKDE